MSAGGFPVGRELYEQVFKNLQDKEKSTATTWYGLHAHCVETKRISATYFRPADVLYRQQHYSTRTTGKYFSHTFKGKTHNLYTLLI